MSIEALSDGDGRDANVTDDDLPIFEGAAPVSDSDALTNPFGPLDEVPILGDEPMTQLRAGGSALAFEEALPTDAGAALPSLLEPIRSQEWRRGRRAARYRNYRSVPGRLNAGAAQVE